MADTLTAFDPTAAGFRVADGPIRRKARTPSAKKQPRPQYADAVWFSYNSERPLEVTVPVRSAEDTVRKLKAAARYLERTESAKGRKVEVRVQVSIEPAMEQQVIDGRPVFDHGEPVMVPVKPAQSVVKFLGHKPWVLGRRVAKVEAEAREAGEQAAADIVAARPGAAVPSPRHRRTVAGTRPTGQHRRPKASLRGTLVGSVITATEPPPSPVRTWGFRCSWVVFPHARQVIACQLSREYHRVTLSAAQGVSGEFLGVGSDVLEEVYREYIEITDDGPPYTVAVRMCHDFPQMRATDQNQLAVFDERVALLMNEDWAQADMPTNTFGVLVC